MRKAGRVEGVVSRRRARGVPRYEGHAARQVLVIDERNRGGRLAKHIERRL